MATEMNQSPAKGFLQFVAYMQIIGIVLVVLGHSFHMYPGGGTALPFMKMLYSFRMPAFMFVSGFLMVFTSQRREQSPARFTAIKAKRLLIPYVVLSLITFVPRALMSGIADDAVEMSAESLLSSLLYADNLVIPFFWFLLSSFTLLVVCHLFLWLCRKARVTDGVAYGALALIALGLLYGPFENTDFLSLYMTVRLGFFFVLGAAYCRYAAVVDRYVPWSSGWFFAGAVAIWWVLTVYAFHTRLFLLCSVAGIAMMVSSAKILEARHWGFLDHLIGANYMIFLMSWYFNVASQQVLAHFVKLPWWIHSCLSLISGIYVPWLAYRYLLRHPDSRWVKLTALLLGQSLKKKG